MLACLRVRKGSMASINAALQVLVLLSMPGFWCCHSLHLRSRTQPTKRWVKVTGELSTKSSSFWVGLSRVFCYRLDSKIVHDEEKFLHMRHSVSASKDFFLLISLLLLVPHGRRYWCGWEPTRGTLLVCLLSLLLFIMSVLSSNDVITRCPDRPARDWSKVHPTDLILRLRHCRDSLLLQSSELLASTRKKASDWRKTVRPQTPTPTPTPA